MDDALRTTTMAQLTERKTTIVASMLETLQPLLHERRERLVKPHLFFYTRVCECCGGGKKKAAACWSCAGFDAAPTQKQMRERMNGAGHSMKKTELERELLQPCKVCAGASRFELFDFNPNSDEQVADVLYNVLKLPVRYNEGKPTVDESALKGLLGGLQQ